VHLLDCDYPVNGAFAYIVGRPSSPRRPNRVDPLVERCGTGRHDAAPAPEADDGMNRWAHEVYTDACLGPKDMDVWMLYDGFSFLP